MNRVSLSFCATSRTRSSPLDTLSPAPCPGRVLPSAFPLADPLPSTASAAPPWALFGGLAGTMGSSDFSPSCITGLRPWPSPHHPPYHHHGRVTEGSPGSRVWRVHAHAWVLRPREVRLRLAKTPHAMLPSVDWNHVGTPDICHFEAQ